QIVGAAIGIAGIVQGYSVAVEINTEECVRENRIAANGGQAAANKHAIGAVERDGVSIAGASPSNGNVGAEVYPDPIPLITEHRHCVGLCANKIALNQIA